MGIRSLRALALLVALTLGVIALGTMALGTMAQTQSSRWGQGYLPNVPVVTQHGKSMRFYDDVLKNKIAVISFIFTSCRDICPVVTARLSQLEDKLGDVVGRDIFFVSISIDPETDTPDKLKEYAAAFQTGPGWLFLTGKKADIDVIRHRLGERSARPAQHRNEILLFNGTTGEWEKTSVFADMTALALTVRAMNPAWRNTGRLDGGPGPANLPLSDHATVGSATANPLALPGHALFTRACGACHSIGGGPKVGPDLVGLMTRRSRDWVRRYVIDPDALRAQKDRIALALVEQYRAVRMPNLGLSEHDAEDVMAYIEAKSYGVEADNRRPPAAHHGHHGHHHHHH
ncbi:MAG: SCO family protein [Hyphomicrobiales bacterium]|nr:SCO family protein [Hyphomicrobiales bacterium]